MVQITLPDGSKRDYPGPVSVADVAASIGAGLAKAALAGKVGLGDNAKVVDTSFVIDRDMPLSIVTAKDADGLEVIRHSTAHLLAYAVKELFPEAQVTIGPVIDNGFYYDFAPAERPFTDEDLPAIEAEMRKIIAANKPLRREVWDREQLISRWKQQGESFKAEWAAELPEGVTRLPIKGIHINKSPMVVRNLKTLSPEMAARWGLDMAQCIEHAVAARALPDMSALWKQVYQRQDGHGPQDVDQDLYNGFVGPNDRRHLNQLRGLNPQELAVSRMGFDDKRLPELVFRWRARNWPQTLNPQEQARWEQLRAAFLVEGQGGTRTAEQMFAQIDDLSENASEQGEEILGMLYDYAESIVPEM